MSPEIIGKDKFHPVIRGEQALGISPELKRRMEAVRSQISQGIEQKEDIVMPGAEVGIVTLGTGGSLPSKYRNGLPFFQCFYMKSVDSFLSIVDTYPDTILGQHLTRYRRRNMGSDGSSFRIR